MEETNVRLNEENKSNKITAYELAKHISSICKCASIEEVVHIYLEEKNIWFPMEGEEGELLIRNKIDDDYKLYINTSIIKEAIKWIKAEGDLVQVTMKDLLERNNYINFRNGVFNIDNFDYVKKKTPELYFQFYLDMDIPDKPDKDEFKKSNYFNYLNETFSEKEAITFQEIVGLCISNIRFEKYAFFFYGPSNTGKSVALNLIRNIIGNKYTSSLSFSQLGESFAVVQLAGKYLNVSGEMSGVASKRIDIFKSLTGNDLITACYKGRDYFQFRNKALFLFACNDLPEVAKTSDADEAFFKRIKILPFKNVVNSNDIKGDLTEILLLEKNIIVANAIEALRNLKNNKFVFSCYKEMNKILEDYANEVNSFLSFTQKHIKRNPKSKVASYIIDNCYRSYCEKYDLNLASISCWSRILKANYHATKIHITDDSSITYNSRGYKGIELVDMDKLSSNSKTIQKADEIQEGKINFDAKNKKAV